MDKKEIINLIEKFKVEQLPDRNNPYHFEAEIASGLKHFENWIQEQDVKSDPEVVDSNVVMTPKEKAIELVDNYKPHVYCYSGSDMLTNTVDENLQLKIAKQCATYAVDVLIWSRTSDSEFDDTKLGIVTHYITPHPMYLSYWLKVKEEINKI